MVRPKQEERALDSQTEKVDENSSTLCFNDFKKALGLGASKYTDEQIESIRLAFDKIADATFDKWLQQRNADTMVLNVSQEQDT